MEITKTNLIFILLGLPILIKKIKVGITTGGAIDNKLKVQFKENGEKEFRGVAWKLFRNYKAIITIKQSAQSGVKIKNDFFLKGCREMSRRYLPAPTFLNS